MLIMHITGQTAWEHARAVGEYRPASLEREGFIHFSKPDQVLQVANAFYRGQSGLVLLYVDPARLQAPLRYEDPVHPGGESTQPEKQELFPHLYGPLNLDAVVKVRPFLPNADGFFKLPE